MAGFGVVYRLHGEVSWSRGRGGEVGRELVGRVLRVDPALGHTLVSLQRIFPREPGNTLARTLTNAQSDSRFRARRTLVRPVSLTTRILISNPSKLTPNKLTLCVSICLLRSCALENAAPH